MALKVIITLRKDAQCLQEKGSILTEKDKLFEHATVKDYSYGCRHPSIDQRASWMFPKTTAVVFCPSELQERHFSQCQMSGHALRKAS